MTYTGHDWDAAWTTIDAAIALTTAGTVQDTSAAQDNDMKSACEISIDTDYSNHVKATGGLVVYIFRDINGTDFESFLDGGFSFEMAFTQNASNRRVVSVPPDMTSKFKIGLEWLNTTGSAVATTKTSIRQADMRTFAVNRCLPSSQLCGVQDSGRAIPFAPGLAALWPLWEGSGSTLMDVSGNGNHGTLTGMTPTTAWQAGQFGRHLAFAGGAEYVAGPTTGFPVDAEPRTMHILCRIANAATDQVICQYAGAGEDDTGFGFRVRNGNMCCSTYYATTPHWDTGWSPSSNTWYHLTMGYDGSDIFFYVNGVQEATVTRALTTAATKWRIGNRPAGSKPFTGDVALIGLWNRLLTAGEIADNSDGLFDLITPRRKNYFWGAAIAGSVAASADPILSHHFLHTMEV